MAAYGFNSSVVWEGHDAMVAQIGQELTNTILEGADMPGTTAWFNGLNQNQRDTIGLFGIPFDHMMSYFTGDAADPVGNAIAVFDDYMANVQPRGLTIVALRHIVDNYEA